MITRLKNAIHVLMGWPLMSGIKIKDGIVTIAPGQKHVRIVDCFFVGSDELIVSILDKGQPE